MLSFDKFFCLNFTLILKFLIFLKNKNFENLNIFGKQINLSLMCVTREMVFEHTRLYLRILSEASAPSNSSYISQITSKHKTHILAFHQKSPLYVLKVKKGSYNLSKNGRHGMPSGCSRLSSKHRGYVLLNIYNTHTR